VGLCDRVIAISPNWRLISNVSATSPPMLRVSVALHRGNLHEACNRRI
jgi:hypothetical protein